jgi:hypothetical protein
MTATPDLAPLDSTRIRAGLAAVRAAMRDGSLHHHSGAGSASRRTPALEVMRLWAAGRGVDEQRRHCRDCAAEDAVPTAPSPRRSSQP